MATWYQTGTVSVTNGSATVTGAGTAWVANARVGQEFRLAGGQRGYEIVQVVSDTEITISPAYLDSTQSAQDYVIVPIPGYHKAAYDALQAGIAAMTAHLDGVLSGLFPDGSAAEPGIAFADDVNTGLRRVSADKMAFVTNGTDRAFLSAGGYELNVPLKGTAVQVAADDVTPGRMARADYVYGPGNVLGTVSQAGGVPTGALIESGSNANGSYAKFADGMMTCWATHDEAALEIIHVAGAGYRCSPLSYTFPAAFAVAPSVGLVAGRTSGSWEPYGILQSLNSASVGVIINSPAVYTQDMRISYVAAGRWY